MIGSRLSAVALCALAIIVSATTVADAATGGGMILGRSNSANRTTTIKDRTGIPLTLSTHHGHAPLSVAGNRTKVANLNSDLVDGLDSTAFQRRVAGSCAAGSAVVAIAATGHVSCHATSASSMVVTGTVSNLGGGAYCPAGWVLGGGGYEQPFIGDESKRDIVRASRPSASLATYNGWFVVVDPRAANSFQVNQPTTVYAVCLKVH